MNKPKERPEWLRLLTIFGLMLYLMLLILLFYAYVIFFKPLYRLYRWLRGQD